MAIPDAEAARVALHDADSLDTGETGKGLAQSLLFIVGRAPLLLRLRWIIGWQLAALGRQDIPKLGVFSSLACLRGFRAGVISYHRRDAAKSHLP
jgi:hypothetical protein